MKTDRKEYLRAYQNKWAKARRRAWLEANGPCRQCGSSDRLEVDHIDPSQKVTHSFWSWSQVRREAELKKCQPLCYSCHKAKTSAHIRTIMTGRPGRPNILTESQVLEIYALKRSGKSTRAVARQLGTAHWNIARIWRGETWAWLTQSKTGQLTLLPRSA